MLEKLKEKQSYDQLNKRPIYWMQLGGLEENGSHRGHRFEHLVPSGWNSLGKIGGVALEEVLQ